MRSSANNWLEALDGCETVSDARSALATFMSPRIDELDQALRDATTKVMNAKTRLTLEDVVSRCSFELDAARELLQLLEDAVFARRVRVDPRELVREAFTSPPSARAEGRPLVSATLSSVSVGQEIEISPRVTMVLVALGVELVGARPGRETPHVVVSNQGDGACTIRVVRRPFPTGEPLVLASRGIIEPTLPCLTAAAKLTGGDVDWDTLAETFTLSYPLSVAHRHGESA